MPDDSSTCPGCASVREGGRWVRRPTGAAPKAVPGAAPSSGAAPSVGGSRPSASGARGCLAAGFGIVLLVVILLVVGLVVASNRPPVPDAPRWSDAYAATFESACRATGAGAAYCRCARSESERRVSEPEMVRFQHLLATGRSLDAADARTLREVERRCAD